MNASGLTTLAAVIFSTFCNIGITSAGELEAVSFEFETARQNTESGVFKASFSPLRSAKPGEHQQGIHPTGQFRFNAQYVTLARDVSWGILENLSIQSTIDGKVIAEAKEVIDTITIRDGQDTSSIRARQLIGFGIGPLSLQSESYIATFDYKVFRADGTIAEAGNINIVISQSDLGASSR